MAAALGSYSAPQKPPPSQLPKPAQAPPIPGILTLYTFQQVTQILLSPTLSLRSLIGIGLLYGAPELPADSWEPESAFFTAEDGEDGEHGDSSVYHGFSEEIGGPEEIPTNSVDEAPSIDLGHSAFTASQDDEQAS